MSNFNFQEAMTLADSAAEQFRIFKRLAELLRESGGFFKAAEAMEERVHVLEAREADAKAAAEQAEADAIATQEEVRRNVLEAQNEADRVLRDLKEYVESEQEVAEATIKALRAEVEAVKVESDFKIKELREGIELEEMTLSAAQARYNEFLASIGK